MRRTARQSMNARVAAHFLQRGISRQFKQQLLNFWEDCQPLDALFSGLPWFLRHLSKSAFISRHLHSEHLWQPRCLFP